VPVTVFGPTDEIDLLALVDSGAEHSVFGLDLADRLNVPLDDAPSVVIVGVGGQESPAFLTNVTLKLGRYRWTGPAVFSSAVSQRAILGQAGFFEFFTVIFRRNKLQDRNPAHAVGKVTCFCPLKTRRLPKGKFGHRD
jgi:hypothetical protein